MSALAVDRDLTLAAAAQKILDYESGAGRAEAMTPDKERRA